MTLDLPVIVLCGGLGTRLRAAVSDRPKALAPVGTSSFLAVQLELLRERGARHFVLCVGEMAEQIEAAFGNGAALGVRVDYVRDGTTLLGTAGVLKRAERFFTPAAIVVNGDTYIDVDLAHLARVHASASALATLMLTRVPDATRYRRIDCNGTRVTSFREKELGDARGNWVNAGVYVIERELLSRIPSDTAMSLERDVFPAVLRDGLTVAAFPQEVEFHDIGTPDALHRFAALREATHAA